ncbi:MAG TPA: outer membrane beta-barrel protein [Chthoniobacterales bacterium]|nr:outer membrane beta-barrel protein [Chthoniobacterales bacterium]
MSGVLHRVGLRLAAGLLATLALLVPASGLRAQQVQVQDRAQLLRPPATSTDPYSEDNGVSNGRAVESENDADIGEQEILKRVERYEPFSISVATPFYYTSNVALVRNGEQSDTIFAPAAGITYAPRFTKTLYGSFTLQRQEFYYDKFSALNFGSFDFRAGLSTILPMAHNLILRAEYDYNRLTFTNSFNDFFNNHSIFLSAELPFRFGRAQQVSLGADANVSLDASPSAPQRDEFDFYVGYAVSLTRSLSLGAVGRIYVRDYRAIDRTDVSEVFALTANYRINKYFSAGAATTLAWSRSNKSVFDYDVANIGGALSLTFKF